jgi:hypothetical protein
LYESQDIPDTPYSVALEQEMTWHEESSLGNMAYLMKILTTWSDVLQCLYRRKHQVVSTERGGYEGFYEKKQRQLQAFIHGLPPHLLHCDRQNIQRALHGGYIGTFISLHALYHTSLMKMNRHAVQGELEDEKLARNLRAAQFHAREFLTVTHTLSALHREQDSAKLSWIFSTAFQGYSILSAVDILTSIGTLIDLKSDLVLVQSSLELLQELGNYWSSAQKQLQMIAVRFSDITKALESASPEDTMFVTSGAMEDTFGEGLDLFFSPPAEVRFKALGCDLMTRGGTGVLDIKTRSPGIQVHGGCEDPTVGSVVDQTCGGQLV